MTDPDAGAPAKTYHHGDLRRALLDSAWELLAEGGIPAVTLRATARRAGVSHSAPHHHFADKAGLIAAMTADGFDQLRRALQSAWDGDGSPVERLAAVGVAYVVFAYDRRDMFALMNRPELHRTASRAATDGVGREAYLVLERAVDRCQQDGFLPAGSPAPWALLAWSGVHGLSMLLIDEWVHPQELGVPDVAALAAGVVASLGHGLRPDPPMSN